jgi:predicted nucleotidyltransferase
LNIPKLGIIMPRMGMMQKPQKASLAEALFSRVQLRVLAILFGQPDRQFSASELIRLAASGSGAVQRELKRLADARLVEVTTSANRKLYRANRKSPLFEDLHGLILKTAGLVEPLRLALQPFAKQIEAAFVYGSVAKGSDNAESDIDLMIISDDLSYEQVFKALRGAEQKLRRPVNPNVMGLREWQRKSTEGGSFAAKIGQQPRLFVIGDGDGLART